MKFLLTTNLGALVIFTTCGTIAILFAWLTAYFVVGKPGYAPGKWYEFPMGLLCFVLSMPFGILFFASAIALIGAAFS